MFRIAHLIDDQSLGGVTRYLEFIANHPAMSALAQHDIVPVSRTNPARTRVQADLIVSHLTISWRGLPGLMALRARNATTPLVHIEHSYSERFAAANVRHRGRFQTLLRTAYSLFDRVVAVSAAQGEWLTRRGLVDAARLEVIRPCVDLSDVAQVPAAEGPQRRIGALGRLDRQKGFDILIEAFRQVRDPAARLNIFGDGPERAALEAKAAGDARITFHGVTPAAAALAQSDVIAMPSRWEPYGLVALEARAAGRTVLVSPADGLADHAAAGAVPVTDLSVAAWTRALAGHIGQSAVSQPRRATEDMKTAVDGWADLIGKVLAGTDAGDGKVA